MDSLEAMESCPSDTAEAGRAKGCEGCPGQQLCQMGAASFSASDPDMVILNTRLAAMKNKFLVVSGKGGVGKSSITTSLAMVAALSATKKGPNKVAVLDLDICGPTLPKLLKIEGKQIVQSEYGWVPPESPHNGIKVASVGSLIANDEDAIIWRGPRKTHLIKQFLKDTFWGRVDHFFIDTPPGTSDEHLTVVKLMKGSPLNGAIIVTTPQEVSLGTIRREITFCKKMGLKIVGLVENMSGFACPCCGEVTDVFGNSGGGEALAAEYGIPFLGKVPLDQNVTACFEKGDNPFVALPESPFVKAVSEIFAKIV